VIERKVQELPLVGRIAAGRPLEAIEERETLSLGILRAAALRLPCR